MCIRDSPNPPNITITRVIPPHIKEARVETIAPVSYTHLDVYKRQDTFPYR